MGLTEYLLLAVVVVVPLVIASAVTLWSLKQVQYRPRKRRPVKSMATESSTGEGNSGAGPASESP
jgi:hypothetical protein